jgi:hypothetical protein
VVAAKATVVAAAAVEAVASTAAVAVVETLVGVLGKLPTRLFLAPLPALNVTMFRLSPISSVGYFNLSTK